jgi:hypothetical protein
MSSIHGILHALALLYERPFASDERHRFETEHLDAVRIIQSRKGVIEIRKNVGEGAIMSV